MTVEAARSRALCRFITTTFVLAALALAGCGSEDSTPVGAPASVPPVTATPEPTPTPTPTPTPVVTVEAVTETEAIPFEQRTVEDPELDLGTSAITTTGVDGVRTLTYEVVFTDGVETTRTLVGDEVTMAPVDEVTTIGTYEPPPPEPEPEPEPAVEEAAGGCDPNYSGCVPIDSDVDCAGGSGNGPSYVNGPVNVIGTDIYDLDADSDGVGCE
ncbi:G5 domain-containing protein [Jiangella gansuensis]|uniref:G5 domain-containing protein n=1 Tax=Jiangella gansuensis TaxID=281473 RepID=UPI0004AD3F99|nr:G5 domain-containing protein [Jiangella gansuensis]